MFIETHDGNRREGEYDSSFADKFKELTQLRWQVPEVNYAAVYSRVMQEREQMQQRWIIDSMLDARSIRGYLEEYKGVDLRHIPSPAVLTGGFVTDVIANRLLMDAASAALIHHDTEFSIRMDMGTGFYAAMSGVTLASGKEGASYEITQGLGRIIKGEYFPEYQTENPREKREENWQDLLAMQGASILQAEPSGMSLVDSAVSSIRAQLGGIVHPSYYVSYPYNPKILVAGAETAQYLYEKTYPYIATITTT